MPRGGRREGAGRKVARHTLEKAELRRLLILAAKKKSKEINHALIDMAIGHWEVVRHPVTGKMINVAWKKPDVMALSVLLDRIMDRPIAPIEMTVDSETKEAKLSEESVAAIAQAIRYALPKDRSQPRKPGAPNAKADS